MRNLKKALNNGEILIGISQAIPDPAITELLGHQGWDYLSMNFAESSASPYGREIENLIRAAYAADIIPSIKLAKIDDEAIAKAVNCGAKAIKLTINSKEEFLAAGKAAKFAPEGYHRASWVRAAGYGAETGSEMAARVNGELVIWPIIETKEAAENMEEIISADGLDVITIGAVDLAISLGDPASRETSEKVRKYWKRLVDLCHPRGIAVEYLALDAEALKYGIELGCRVLHFSSEVRMLFNATQQGLADVKDLIEQLH